MSDYQQAQAEAGIVTTSGPLPICDSLNPRAALVAQMAATIYAGSFYDFQGARTSDYTEVNLVIIAREILAEAERQVKG